MSERAAGFEALGVYNQVSMFTMKGREDFT